MLQLQAIGNVVRDAESRMIGGTNYTSFTLAVNVSKDNTIFVNVRKRAGDNDKLMGYITKGRKLFVQGSMSAQGYISKTTGEAVPDLTIWADSIEFLNKQEEQQ